MNVKSLRTKIYVGFAVIVSLLVAVGLIGYSSAKTFQDSSNAMREISEVNAVVLEIDRNVQELQLRVSRYMTSGHESLRADVVSLNDKLVATIEDAANGQTDPEMRNIFQRMSEHLPECKHHFDSVFEERQMRVNLVQREKPLQSAVIEATLRELHELLDSHELASEIGVAVVRCETLISQAEKLFLRYYIAADSILVNQAISNLKEAVDTLNSVSDHQRSADLRRQLVDELEVYERISIRAVQATRSYLYLVNVVMAGEASEVTYYSNRLRILSEQRRDAITREVAATVANVRTLTGFGIAIALGLALFISGRLAISILRPITSLTETFRRLAAGGTVVLIPEVDRTDEIGEMAAAAGVFSEQNVRQRELLLSSERLRRELAVKAEELEKTNADLDSFAYVASHDLKSPLRAIRQLASWIDEDSGHLLPEESVKHFLTMQSRVQRMELLLDDLLNFSRIGKTAVVPEQVNVCVLLTEISELIDNPQEVSIHWPKDMPTLLTDRVPLEQVFLNLIGNGVKHNDKGKAGIVEINFEHQTDSYRFSVADNGPGIGSQHHDRVFQMYQRVGDTSIDGSGMGLSIVKKQIERQGGSICLDSNSNGGVTFHFNWPRNQTFQKTQVQCLTTSQQS